MIVKATDMKATPARGHGSGEGYGFKSYGCDCDYISISFCE
jgi:hypothetical protein